MTDDRITIIEGPPPTFEPVQDAWALGMNDTSALSIVTLTRLRTHNGPALVQRCYRAWHEQLPINLHYRGTDGMEQTAPIIAARSIETDEGYVLLLWLYFNRDRVELEFGPRDDDEDDLYRPY
jgi:hypothetical protein